MAQLVARLTGGQEAVSSSLATRTKQKEQKPRVSALFVFRFATFAVRKVAILSDAAWHCFPKLGTE